MSCKGETYSEYFELEFEIMVPYCKKYYLLGLVDGVRHGEEGAVGENGQHDKVVEILID